LETAAPGKEGVRESFPIADVDGPLLLPVTVAGKEYPFLLDTACTGIIFDSRLEPHLGTPIGEATIADARGLRIKTYAAPKIRIRSLTVSSAEIVGCADFSRFREAAGEEIYGFLGLPAMEGLVIRIDFDARRIDILAGTPPPGPERGDAISFVRDGGGYLRIMGTVGADVKRAFVIDTGLSSAGGLDRSLVAELTRSVQFRETSTGMVTTIGYEERRSSGRLARLAVGSFEHHDLVFSCGNKNLLGLEYLRRYRVTIDFPGETIYLRKGNQFSRPDSEDMSGLHVLRKEGRFVVYAVDKESPADLAGIGANDVLAAIQGKPASAYRLSQIRRLLMSGDGEAIRVTVKRGGREILIAFRLKKDPPSPEPRR
jgi:hypothetical protein